MSETDITIFDNVTNGFTALSDFYNSVSHYFNNIINVIKSAFSYFPSITSLAELFNDPDIPGIIYILTCISISFLFLKFVRGR